LRNKKEISKKKYIESIRKIRLNVFYLKSASADIDRDALFKEKPIKHGISIKDEASIVLKDNDSVDILHRYSLEILSKDKETKPIGRIDCTFCLNFSPAACFTPEFFEEFKKANLHINTRPFFREFVFNITARMSIPPILLPLLKAMKK
jgi:hypothetical protein